MAALIILVFFKYSFCKLLNLFTLDFSSLFGQYGLLYEEIDLAVSEREAMRNQLMKDNHDVRKAYAVFFAQLVQSFIKRKVDPREIQSIVHSYCSLEKDPHEQMVFDFRRDDSVSDVFIELSKHCTWFNYDALQVLVEILGDESERKCLKEYEDIHLIPYLKRSIFKIPCAPPHTQSQHTEFALFVSADLVITGRERKSIQHNLAKLLDFQSSAIRHFYNYNEELPCEYNF